MSEHQTPDASSSGNQGASAQGNSDSSNSFGAGLKVDSKSSGGRTSKARATKVPRKKRGTRGGRRKTTDRKPEDELQEAPRSRESEPEEEGKAAPKRKTRAKKAPARKRATTRSRTRDEGDHDDDRRSDSEERAPKKATRKRTTSRSRARDEDDRDDGRRSESDDRDREPKTATRKRAPRRRSPARSEDRPRDDYDGRDDYDRDDSDSDRNSARGRDRDEDRGRGRSDGDRGRSRTRSRSSRDDDDHDRDRDDRGRAPRKKVTRTRSRGSSSSSRDDDRDRDRDDYDRDDRYEDEDRGTGRSRTKKRASKKKASKKRASKKKASKKATRTRRSPSDEHEDDRDRDGEDAPKIRKKATRKRSRKSTSGKTDEELAAEAEALRTKTILVNSTDPEERRVVVVGKEGRIDDLLMTAESQKNLVNDIYRGKVVNLEPAIGAAFVDFGQGRNGFLHTSDVLPVYGENDFTLEKLITTRMEDEEGHPDVDDDDDHQDDEDDAKGGSKKKAKSSKRGRKRGGGGGWRTRQRLPISDLLKVGDQVVVQITKDAIGDKGPTLTTYISIPGRYLVLMPSMARTGVSRKIPDDNERRRLKRILTQLNAPEEMGVIVRTAGVGKLKRDLKRDLDYLLGVWKTFESKLRQGRGPTPLYQESDVATRTLRDLFNKETKEVVVDDFAVHESMVEFAERLMPEHVERIKRYEGQRPIFHDFGIEQDFEQIFNRSVDLPSGGSIVFDQAEALVAIDVNSGRTRTNSFDFEEVALKTNLEAVPEIALQIRLRDLGGIIVCDFIDMMKSSSNRAVERALRAELVMDRARSKVGRIGQFGLLELTRQRLGPGTHKKVFQACPRCRGTGRIRTVQSRAQAILRRLGSALTQKGFSRVEVRAHPEVVTYLKENLSDYTRALEHRFEREIQFTSVPDQAEDSVLRYLRVDGREVRPGGRRKR
ncbi:MAG: Rne/Rng family ribonuclease [bacterium]|nr:Rne/Rng family ribonuclease [bacterium]